MDIQAELDAAIDHHRHGRITEARAGYDAVLAADPGNVHAMSVSAILLFQLGEQSAAIERLESAVRKQPGNAALHNNLGNMFRKTDRLEEAYAAYRAAVSADPMHVDSICNLAMMVRNGGAIEDAVKIFEEALAIAPGHVESNHNLGITYALMGRYEDAADHFERCYGERRVPVVDPSWHAQILELLGRRERAIEILESHAAARPDDPVAQHNLAAIRGETLDRASDGYVREHFDEFAEHFDDVLGRLDYKAPEIVGSLVQRLCDGRKVGFLYDLGCGTGRAGPLVRDCAAVLVGVDLSPQMLARAARRDCYDELITAEITAALAEIPAGTVDMAIAVDTLIYFGDLGLMMQGLARALKPGGAFVGTVECHADDDASGGARILSSGRFSHSSAHIRDRAAAAGLVVHAINDVILRKEFKDEVAGYAFLLENRG